jgi:hypothetical protein
MTRQPSPVTRPASHAGSSSSPASAEHRSRTDDRSRRSLPREYRIAHVFRTMGRGLVAEYDPA